MFERLLNAFLDLPVPESAYMTWGLMGMLTLVTLLLHRKLGQEGLSKLENTFEMLMEFLLSQIREIIGDDPKPYVPLIATLFLFVLTSNLLGMVPGLSSPTADLSVTGALAVIVFLSVPYYGLRERGAKAYLNSYLRPNPMMLPFNVLGEFTRTLALAVRLFGNIMSGEFLMAVVIFVVTTMLRGYARVFMPFGFALTLFLSVLSLITGLIQAYIFTVLALVYIGAAVERRSRHEEASEDASQQGAD